MEEQDLIGRLTGMPLIIAMAAVQNCMRYRALTMVDALRFLQYNGIGNSFRWATTPQGNHVWININLRKDYKLFFEKIDERWLQNMI